MSNNTIFGVKLIAKVSTYLKRYDFWHAKEYVNDIGLSNHLLVLEKVEDILLDRKDVRCVHYLSNGMDYVVHAAVLGSG